jgi:hypothetical protein
MKHSRIAILVVMIVAVISSCGQQNFFEGFTEAKSDEARLAEAEALIDEKEYAKALGVINEVEGDTNEKRMLEVAASLGASGVSIWQLIIDIINNQLQSSDDVSFDQIFASMSADILGTGTEKTAKITAMQSSIQSLIAAPDPAANRLVNLNCFLGGVLSVITVTDGEAALTQVQDALTTIQQSSTGSGSTADECPGIDDLSTGLERINQVQSSLGLILQATQGCGFINLGENSPNRIEENLNQVISAADKGCEPTPSCGSSEACQALSLGCVQEEVDVTAGVADDSEVASCELVQNCIGTDCFGS